MERLQKFWMAGACKKNEAKGEASKSLEVLNFTSAFILLACGMLLGSFLLLLEHVYFAFFRVRLRKCDTVGCCSLVSLVRVAAPCTLPPYMGLYYRYQACTSSPHRCMVVSMMLSS